MSRQIDERLALHAKSLANTMVNDRPIPWLLLAAALVPLTVLALHADATSIPAEPDHVRLLDGAWRFKLEQADPVPAKIGVGGKPHAIRLPDHFEPFQTLDYKEDSSWHALNVPGNWEMAGYSPATYNEPDNAIGIYRLWFDVPADWKGRDVRLNFDGVQNGAEIYLNGQPVNVTEPADNRANYHEGGFDAFQVDLTPAVKFGEKNLLAVRVYKNTPSVEMDTGDYFFLGGIHRSVTLFSVDAAHIETDVIRTHLLGDHRAEARVIADIAGAQAGDQIAFQLQDQPQVKERIDVHGHAEVAQVVNDPHLWSAEHPNLYTAAIDLLGADGKLIEHLSARVGIREVTIRDGVLLVNNVPVKLTGMCRHDLDPYLGSALNEKAWRRDLELMRAANVNAIRTSHYPYGAGFYDLCDEMGFYVADEMAACWTPSDTDALTPAFERHARELVGRDLNHPSVIIWAVGNENRPGKNLKITADIIRELDPTRPRLVSNLKADVNGVEFDDKHYPTPEEVQNDLGDPRRQTVPQIYLENPNVWEARNGADFGCLDLWVNVIDHAWQDVWNNDHFSGSFLWEWADRAVADQSPVKLYDFDPATGINLVKVKGIVDAFRNPRPDYYHVKVVYAPIKVDLKPVVSPGLVTVHAVNHLSFTDLSELNTTWHLLKGEQELASATIHPALAPRSGGDLKLQVPGEKLAQAEVLRLVFDRADGLNIVTYDLRLRPEVIVAPKLAALASPSLTFPQLNLTTVTYGADHVGWHWAFRHPGELTNVVIQKAGGGPGTPIDAAALAATPLSLVRSLDADVLVARARVNPVAHVHVDFSSGQFSYHVKWLGADADIQELGWGFSAPGSSGVSSGAAMLDHFSWHRQGYWSYYPPDHIGRISGTATPDSAKADVTKISRADAFDFNSTKYNCDWVSLTDRVGSGIAVLFQPDQRQQCRGQINPDGSTGLVVNKQCSPPQDLSSSVVPDLYLKLKPGNEVNGAFLVGSTEAGAH
jgi:beta-galactosidase